MDSDDRMLRVFDVDPDRAEKRIQDLGRRLIFFFRKRYFVDPEDLSQETLRRGFEGIRKGKKVEPTPERFMFGIAHNVAFETWRAAANRPTVSLDDLLPSLFPVDFRDPDATILLGEYLRRIPPDEADLLVRYHTEDRAKLAAELNVASGTLRVQVFRAVQKLNAWVTTPRGSVGRCPGNELRHRDI
jgi:DNA-directed RNA polymerase specialized sigma24 family protein